MLVQGLWYLLNICTDVGCVRLIQRSLEGDETTNCALLLNTVHVANEKNGLNYRML